MHSTTQLVLSVTATAVLITAALISDRQKLDAKVLSLEYDKCIANIPIIKDSEYTQALKECMNNARVIARATAR